MLDFGAGGMLLGAGRNRGTASDECGVRERVRVETWGKQVQSRQWEVGLEWSNMEKLGCAIKRSSRLSIEVGQDESMVAKMIDQRPKCRKQLHARGGSNRKHRQLKRGQRMAHFCCDATAAFSQSDLTAMS